MRSLSAELLAAALSMRGRPSVSLDIHDKRLRWTGLHWADGSTKWTDQVADAAVIHRVRSNGTDIEWCKVSTPTTEAEWTDWSLAKATDVTDGEVAIACIATDDIRLFALRVDVADTTWDIVYLDSTDGGANWDAAWSVAVAGIDGAKAGDTPEHPRLAAVGDHLFYTDAGSVKAIHLPWGGAPGVGGTWADLGVLTVRGGLGVDWTGTGYDYAVAAAGAGNISIGIYTSNTQTWSTARQIAPGGVAPATDTDGLRNPSVLVADSIYFIAWLDVFLGADSSWTQQVVLSSTDWIHFGNEVALSIWATTDRRVALAYLAGTKTLYAANEKITCQAAFWESDDALQNLTGIAPTRYHRQTDHRGSHLTINVLNKAGLYDTVQQAGEYGQCIRPLAILELTRGYITKDPGPPPTHQVEAETLDPHYILSAGITQGFDRNHLHIEAVDGWGLLDLWRPNETLTWSGETIEWLATEICARVGLAFAFTGTSMDYAIPTFTVHPSQPGAEILQRLLLLSGCVAWFDEAGVMQARELYGYSPSYFDVGTESEILEGSYAASTVAATSFRIFGDGAGAAGEVSWISMSLGLRINRNRQDYRLASDAACQVLQRLDWTRARMQTRKDWVLVPMRPDPEMWDRVRVFPGGDVIPAADCLRRVVGIQERWDAKQFAAKHRPYTTRLEMEDA